MPKKINVFQWCLFYVISMSILFIFKANAGMFYLAGFFIGSTYVLIKVGLIEKPRKRRSIDSWIIPWKHDGKPCKFYDNRDWCDLDQPCLCCPCYFYEEG